MPTSHPDRDPEIPQGDPSTPFARVAAALATPFTAAGEVDTGLLADHARALLETGADGLVLFGTTGEAASLTVTERQEALEALVAAGLPAHQILVGTGCPALGDALALTTHAIDQGVEGVLVIPPYFYKGVSDNGLFAGYDALICAVDRPEWSLYLYHFPKMSAVPLSVDLVSRLAAAHPHILKGIKDSSSDVDYMRAVRAALPDLHVFAGSDLPLVDLLEMGGAGCISATANIQAGPIRAIVNAFETQDHVLGAAQAKARTTRMAMQDFPMIAAIKAILAERYGKPAWRAVRPPLVALDDETRAALFERLRAPRHSL